MPTRAIAGIASLFVLLFAFGRAEAQDFLDQPLAAHGARVVPGGRPLGYPFRGPLAQGQVYDFTAYLSAGACYSVIAVGGPQAQDIDLTLWDPNQRRAGTDRERSNQPVLQHCARVAGPYRVEVKMTRGEGPFAATVVQHPAAAAAANGPFAPTAPAPTPIQPVAAGPLPQAFGPDYLPRRLQELAQHFAPGQVPSSQVYQGTLGQRSVQDVSVPLEYGRCYMFIATATPATRDIDLFVFDPSGSPVGQDDANDNYPHVRVCPRLPGPYRAQILSSGDAGPYAMQVFVQ